MDTLGRPPRKAMPSGSSLLSPFEFVEGALDAYEKGLKGCQHVELVVANPVIEQHLVDNQGIAGSRDLGDASMEALHDAPADRSVADAEHRVAVVGRQIEILKP